MIPVLVTAATPHGVATSRPWGVPLDALLSSVLWHRRKWEARAAGHHLAYHPDLEPEAIELPLARCHDPDHQAAWHWMATFADMRPGGGEPDIRWRTSRTDRRRLQQLAPVTGNVVSDTSGRYLQRTVPVIAHPVATLTWHAVGDPDGIRELLAELPSIGKHRGTGEGVVARWTVTEAPDVAAWSAGHEHEPGVLGRTVPLRCLKPGMVTGEVGFGAIRPPYLHPFSRTDAAHPAR